MKLFFSPTSPYVRKCLATAHELGLAGRITLLPSQAHPVNRDASIVAANPLGKVPTLLTDDGQALYDSRVICEYLDHLGGGRLFPGDGTRWNALALQALGDGILDAALLARYEDAARPENLRWAEWRRGQLDKVATSLAALEAGTPALDDTVHIGSLAIGCALWYLDLRYGQEIAWRPQHPKLAAWWGAVRRAGFDEGELGAAGRLIASPARGPAAPVAQAAPQNSTVTRTVLPLFSTVICWLPTCAAPARASRIICSFVAGISATKPRTSTSSGSLEPVFRG